ncbi:hypothetical protein KP004_19840 [Geomonas oryzisoli]|uniref:Porin n=1 Tax=Geomonas oryzisoli TaxID=2847992 RepID=A0ABX8J742_9BACT|nr:TonB-dependent receptor [Geomonas oryzisoli]QWV93389.1 hypothetical protein KP004_19840 [Geomonas oryzisoli]
MKKTLTAMMLFAFAGSAHAVDLAGVEIHGFASQGYIKTSPDNNFPVSNSGEGSFNFNDFAVNFSKEVNPDLRVGLQLLAMDRGSYGKDKITLDWGFGDYRLTDWLGFRAGKIKIPLGLYNESRDNDAARTFIFLPQNEYYDYERDSVNAITGASVYGSVPVGPAGTVNYQFQIGTTPIPLDGASAKNYSAYISTVDAPLTTTDVNSDTAFVHHLEWRTPVGVRATFSGLHTSFDGTASGIYTDPVTSATTPVTAKWKFDSWHRYILGVEYILDDLTLATEYQRDDYTVSADYQNPALENFTSRQASDGWYVSAAYRFTDWFELGGYYTEIYADRHHRDGSTFEDLGVGAPWQTWQKEKVLTLRFDPMRNLVLKVEGHLIDGTWNMSEYTDASKRNWYLVATKATVFF